MAGEEFKRYPKARVAMGAGDLRDAVDITHKTSKGVEQVHTLVANPSGLVTGKKTSEISFKSAISAEGFERDYYSKYENEESVQFRIKLPGKTITQTGLITDLEVTSNVDGVIEFSCTHKGGTKYG